MSRTEVMLVGVLALIWVPGLLALSEVVSTVEYASHGYLVPLVALWAATAHRERLAELPSEPLPGGLLILGGVGVGYVAGLLFGQATILGLLAVATVVACVLALRGPGWVKAPRFPLAYLLFMVPLPISWATPVIVKLQVLVSTIGVRILRGGGVAVFREGNVLTLPGDESLFVAEACSGITFLITLISIGVFIAYFTEFVLCCLCLLGIGAALRRSIPEPELEAAA